MDRRGVDAVRRIDFVWALSALGASVNFQKTCRRAGLPAHFHDTAKDLSLEEFLRLLLPTLTASDMECMFRWGELRKALNKLMCPGFKAVSEELQDVFQLLCEAGNRRCPLGALIQAEILTQEELQKALPRTFDSPHISFDDFKSYLQPVLHDKFVRPDESESDWRAEARSRFSLMRVSTPIAWQEDADQSGGNSARGPQGLPRLPRQRTAGGNALAGRHCRRAEKRSGVHATATKRLERAPGEQRAVFVPGYTAGHFRTVVC